MSYSLVTTVYIDESSGLAPWSRAVAGSHGGLYTVIRANSKIRRSPAPPVKGGCDR